MSGAGYTYTTLSAGPDEPTHVRVSFHLDDQAQIAVYGMDSGRPHLGISHGDVEAAVGPCGDAVTAQDARLARVLADKAAAYATEMERLCAVRDPSGSATSAA
jgi:hypothetical protein